jgi:DNA-binding transcriptional ArsR family regulator
MPQRPGAESSGLGECAKQLDALGAKTRRAILCRLIGGPRRVGDIARDFRISRPAISQHLRVLTEASLVVIKTSGHRRLYALNLEGLSCLCESFSDFANEAAHPEQ